MLITPTFLFFFSPLAFRRRHTIHGATSSLRFTRSFWMFQYPQRPCNAIRLCRHSPKGVRLGFYTVCVFACVCVCVCVCVYVCAWVWRIIDQRHVRCCGLTALYHMIVGHFKTRVWSGCSLDRLLNPSSDLCPITAVAAETKPDSNSGCIEVYDVFPLHTES